MSSLQGAQSESNQLLHGRRSKWATHHKKYTWTRLAGSWDNWLNVWCTTRRSYITEVAFILLGEAKKRQKAISQVISVRGPHLAPHSTRAALAP